MRQAITLAAALAALSVVPAGAAHAEGWCGYAARVKAMIECGYSSANECESAMGKGGMCFIDPNYALNVRRAAPDNRHPEAATTSAFTRVFDALCQSRARTGSGLLRRPMGSSQ